MLQLGAVWSFPSYYSTKRAIAISCGKSTSSGKMDLYFSSSSSMMHPRVLEIR